MANAMRCRNGLYIESNGSYNFCIISRVFFGVLYLDRVWGYYDNSLCLNLPLFFTFIAVVTKGLAQKHSPLVLNAVAKHRRVWALP